MRAAIRDDECLRELGLRRDGGGRELDHEERMAARALREGRQGLRQQREPADRAGELGGRDRASTGPTSSASASGTTRGDVGRETGQDDPRTRRGRGGDRGQHVA